MVVKSYLQVKPLVRRLLWQKPELRNSDKHLFWEYFKEMGLTIKPNSQNEEILIVSKSEWMQLHEMESITRARRKLQEEEPELRADADIEHERELEEDAMRHTLKEEKRWF